MPGLFAARSTTEELRACMKANYVVARVDRGRSEWWAHGKLWRSGPGSIQLKAPGDVHRDVAHDGPITFQVAVLPASEFELLHDEGRTIALPHLEAGDERAGAFHRLHDAIGAGVERLPLEVLVTEAMAAFMLMRSTASHQTRPVRRAMDYLRERITDSVTLDDLAAHAGLDKFHLCRAFRAQIGMPPHTYLTHLRIARARRLLEHGVVASEVASLVGLYDQSQLNRHFRRIVGTTPGRYASGRVPRIARVPANARAKRRATKTL